MKRNVSIVELIIVIALIAIIARVVSYKRGSKPADLTSMVLIKGCSSGDFYIGRYEVTNKEYCRYEPFHNNPGDNLPVVNVGWDAAVKYCTWLSDKTGKDYRLPTQAEWEYACRAGSSADYYWGANYVSEHPPPVDIDDYCWYYKNSGFQVHPVGQRKPNAWGLYDMSGNVWEFCSEPDDSSRPNRYVRGGSWGDNANFCQSSYCRDDASPIDGNNYFGFRVVMSP